MRAADFFDTSNDHESLVVRPKGCVEAVGFLDNVTPSGGAMTTMVMYKLGAYTGDARYVEAGESAVAPLQSALAQAPTGFAWWLNALDFELAPPKEIAIVGEDAQPLFDVVFGEYRQNQVVAWKREGDERVIPLLGDRQQIGGKATAYGCVRFACQMPVTEADALDAQLNG